MQRRKPTDRVLLRLAVAFLIAMSFVAILVIFVSGWWWYIATAVVAGYGAILVRAAYADQPAYPNDPLPPWLEDFFHGWGNAKRMGISTVAWFFGGILWAVPLLFLDAAERAQGRLTSSATRRASMVEGSLPTALVDRQMLDLVPCPRPNCMRAARMVAHRSDYRPYRLGPPRRFATSAARASWPGSPPSSSTRWLVRRSNTPWRTAQRRSNASKASLASSPTRTITPFRPLRSA